MGKSKKKVQVAPVDEESSPVATPGPLPADSRRPTSAELNESVEVNDLEMLKAGARGSLAMMKEAAHMGADEVQKLNMFKKENRQAQVSRFGAGFRFLMRLTSDPVEEAERVRPLLPHHLPPNTLPNPANPHSLACTLTAARWTCLWL